MKPTVKPIVESDASSGDNKKKSTNSKGKKRKAESNADEEEEDDDELIDVEFGLYDPKPIDYLTVKMMLKDYVINSSSSKKKKAAAASAEDDGDEESSSSSSVKSSPSGDDFALHELCDSIVDQVAVGSTIKGEGTEEPFGFLSALSFDWHEKYGKNQDGGKMVWPAQLKKYIIQKAPSHLKSIFEQTLADPRTALLIQGRLINAPPQIIPQLHTSLQEDIAWALENTGEYGKHFDIGQYVMIGRKFKPAPGSKGQLRQDVLASAQFSGPLGAAKGKKKQKQAAAAANTANEELEWLRFEEELYARESSAQYTFACPFTSEDAAAGRQPQSCVVMIIPQAKLPTIVQELQLMAAMA